jgi:hypothetical protein
VDDDTAVELQKLIGEADLSQQLTLRFVKSHFSMAFVLKNLILRFTSTPQSPILSNIEATVSTPVRREN